MPRKDSVKWTPEAEARLALLMRNLAGADDASRKSVVEEIQEISDGQSGADPSRILNWYLQRHLGFERPIEALLGTSSSKGVALAASGLHKQEFMKPEYDWCAAEKIESDEDLEKLRQVYSDLESKIEIETSGPLSFTRLTGIDDRQRGYFLGKSLSEAIFSADVTVDYLRIIKDYGKLLMLSVMPTHTQRSGAILYAASISQALVAFDSRITSLGNTDLASSLRSIISRPYIVETYQRLFAAALAKCGEK